MASPAFAEREKPLRLGVDFAMPYSLYVDGNSLRERANLNLGVDGRYWMNENVNLGLRVAFDVEKQTGTTRQFQLSPGLQYHWMPLERWNPYVRVDLPVHLRGNQDIGLTAGLGMAWNLGDAIGVENMSLRYDFDINYMFGLGDALDVLALDIFKVGFDYNF